MIGKCLWIFIKRLSAQLFNVKPDCTCLGIVLLPIWPWEQITCRAKMDAIKLENSQKNFSLSIIRDAQWVQAEGSFITLTVL